MKPVIVIGSAIVSLFLFCINAATPIATMITLSATITIPIDAAPAHTARSRLIVEGRTILPTCRLCIDRQVRLKARKTETLLNH